MPVSIVILLVIFVLHLLVDTSIYVAQLRQSAKIGTKDERKFLDGVFVTNRGVVKAIEE